MGFTLEVDNYRALRKVRWSPSGVCAVTGPNGSGKTTLLSATELLHFFLERGIQTALDFSGGSALLRNLQATREEDVALKLTLGGVTWSVRLIPKPPGFGASEVISVDGEIVAEGGGETNVVELPIQSERIPGHRDPVLPLAMRLLQPPYQGKLDALDGFVSGYRLYQNLHLWTLRSSGSPLSTHGWLHQTGQNAFSVLRNWKAGRREDEERWLFVRSGLRECSPELFEDLEFLAAGQTVTVQLYLRGHRVPIDVFSAPNGLLITLLHLCAVASAPDGGAVAIDEPENGLHPFAIRTLLELMRERAAARDLTILLATHSPVVLNTFNTEPGRVYIMEPSHEVLPVALDQHRDPEWLAHFALGDLKGSRRGAFPAPGGAQPRLRDTLPESLLPPPRPHGRGLLLRRACLSCARQGHSRHQPLQPCEGPGGLRG